MSERPNAREWVNADVWRRYLSGSPEAPPLTYSGAETIARLGEFEYEHQSDGTTLIRVGAANVAAATAFSPPG